MFYSHEVLTSRKYGVATVWLVATLGSKSSLKKVSRKAILDVNVAKACDTIIGPEAPMALRLQSNLLYGVTRVYAQQCGYVLSDAENARNSMRAMLKLVKQAGLEPDGANKARPDQIILQDDPNFLPDLDMMPVDLDNINFTYMEDTQQTSLSSHGSAVSRTITGSQQSIGGLVIPPSNSSFAGGPVRGADLFSVRGDSGPGTAVKTAPRDLVDDDLGLDYGQDIDSGSGGGYVRQPRGGSEPTADAVRDESGQPGQPMLDNGGYMLIDDGYPADHDPFNPADSSLESGHDHTHHETTSETATAPNRKKRNKTVPVDEQTTLHNHEISNWNKTYLERMKAENSRKQILREINIAKRNADFLMLFADTWLALDRVGPLDMFSGAGLLEAFTGINMLTGEKRPRSVDDKSGRASPKRRRTEASSDEVGRNAQHGDDFLPLDDDTIEQGREAPTPLDDRQQSSLFPWNQSVGSRRTDAHPTSASFGGGPQLNLLPRPGSRLTSASPLVGRGPAQPAIVVDDFQLDPGTDLQMDDLHREDDFELYGAAAQVDTQTAAQSQWQNSILTSESANFLSFVESALNEGEQQDESIDFETLLPPKDNSNIVAAQAMLHVLTLGTKGVLAVDQEEPFGPMSLRVIENAA